MLDPTAVSILTTAIEKAADVANQHLAEAKRIEKSNIVACVSYLEAARTAIRGLEDEVDEMLIETEQIADYHWEKRPDILKRIREYLHRDRLRPILDESLQGITACLEFAKDDARSFFQWPQHKTQKIGALDNLTQLLEGMSWYLKALSPAETDLQNYFGPSGIDVEELLDLEILLDDSQARTGDELTRKSQIKELVDKLQEKRQRSGLPLVAMAKNQIQKLTVAFRLTDMD